MIEMKESILYNFDFICYVFSLTYQKDANKKNIKRHFKFCIFITYK